VGAPPFSQQSSGQFINILERVCIEEKFKQGQKRIMRVKHGGTALLGLFMFY